MSIKPTDRKARENYRKKVVTLRIELYPTDEDIKERLAERQAQDEKTATYIKRLIRQDIQQNHCKNCEHYTPSKYTESGFYCGMHSGAYEFVEMNPEDFCNYWQERKAQDIQQGEQK